eukprot:gb/GECG01006230.1/.p1 GENE.gb/GECG01006230.1/~~gb/GECG01006230.1/.p1  ORF type:complete len:112 (+),score=15.01 gb/GECG01006230.1/:1-336(+)
MGRLKIRHHYPCSYQEEEHEDVVGVNWTNEYIDSKQNEIRNFGGMTSSVEEAKEAVNDFLKARRERTLNVFVLQPKGFLLKSSGFIELFETQATECVFKMMKRGTLCRSLK